MGRLERGTELYNRYVKKFGEQEDQVETLRTEIKKLQDQEEAKRQELEKILREA
jgi:cell division protein FtsB